MADPKTPGEILVELSPLEGPATPAEHLLAIAELGTGGGRTVLEIRVYEGIEAVMEEEEVVSAVVVEEETTYATVVDEEVVVGTVAEEDAVAGVVVEEETMLADSETVDIEPTPEPTLYALYYGPSASAVINTELGIKGLGNVSQSATPELDVTLSPSLEYIYYALPARMPNAGDVIFEIGNFGVGDVIQVASNVTVDGEPYTVYRSQNVLDYLDLAFTVTI